ncbi:hypothetical protein BX600DRAFT_447245 [Xylariales sp. PMI_506]|nr:hypothetical protein BX600DRAFT_447245 [Xylariales sp. PMI_506]
MSGPNILITGVSGYLGGSLLAALPSANLPSHGTIYALVRSETQAAAVRSGYPDVEPIIFDAYDADSVREALISRSITVVFFLIDAMNSDAQVLFIRSLAEVKKTLGQEVHFLHTSGAKLFSSLSGSPTDRELLDTDENLYEIQKKQKSQWDPLQRAVNTNNTTIEECEKHGVRSYIFVPCIVYGKGEGFGNPISIQTVAIIRAARAVRRVYRVETERNTWPVCHIKDNTALYLTLLRAILDGSNPDYGRNGYYLASPGSVAWDDLYAATAEALTKRGVVENAEVYQADSQALEAMGAALGCPPDMVVVMLAGKCTLTAVHGKNHLGWTPSYKPEHILEDADAEVELVLGHLNKSN